MCSFVLRSLSYVDDEWIMEAQEIDQQKQEQIALKNKRRKQYFYSGLCAAAIICAITISLVWSLRKRNQERLPLESIKTEEESSESEETQTEEKSEKEVFTSAGEENTGDNDNHQPFFHMNREFTAIIYGYAGAKMQINDSASRELICSTIESVPLETASKEDMEKYQETIGQYLLEFDNGVTCAMTTDYFYYSSRDQEETRLYCFEKTDSYYEIIEMIERMAEE